MLKQPVPSLSTEGWIYDVPTAVNALLSYYCTTDAAQSNFYRDDMFSLAKDGQIVGLKSRGFADLLEEKLQNYLHRYLSEVVVSVVDAEPDSQASQRTLQVLITVQNEPVNAVIRLDNGRFEMVHRLSIGA